MPLRILVFYIGALAVIMSIIPWTQINPDDSPFVKLFALIGIPFAAGIINFVVLTAAALCNNLFNKASVPSNIYGYHRIISITLYRSIFKLRYSELNVSVYVRNNTFYSTIYHCLDADYTRVY